MSSKFTKSRTNRGTEKEGLSVLLRDRRFQVVSLPTKRRLLDLIGHTGDFGIQTFDAVMTNRPQPPLDETNIEANFSELRLIEMKTTRKPIQNAALNGFFFGATERERAMAAALGDRYLFAFVVLNASNSFERPFAVLLSLEDVEARTRPWRVQYQVNFKTDLEAPPVGAKNIVILGDDADLASKIQAD